MSRLYLTVILDVTVSSGQIIDLSREVDSDGEPVGHDRPASAHMATQGFWNENSSAGMLYRTRANFTSTLHACQFDAVFESGLPSAGTGGSQQLVHRTTRDDRPTVRTQVLKCVPWDSCRLE
jgi:hypothetical protein